MNLTSPFSLTIGAIVALSFLGLPIGHAMIGGSIFAYSIGKGSSILPPGSSFLVGAVMCALGWCLAAWATRHIAPMPAPVAANAEPSIGA